MGNPEDLQDAMFGSIDPEMFHDLAPTLQPPFQYLADLLKERGWLVRDAIRACYLDRSYGYQLFNGTRPPTRNFLLRLALVLELDERNTQHLLARCAKPILYPRNRYDAAVLYALGHRLSLEETDELLQSLGEQGLL